MTEITSQARFVHSTDLKSELHRRIPLWVMQRRVRSDCFRSRCHVRMDGNECVDREQASTSPGRCARNRWRKRSQALPGDGRAVRGPEQQARVQEDCNRRRPRRDAWDRAPVSLSNPIVLYFHIRHGRRNLNSVLRRSKSVPVNYRHPYRYVD
jgi:hypothetical protein